MFPKFLSPVQPLSVESPYDPCKPENLSYKTEKHREVAVLNQVKKIPTNNN